MKLNRSDHRVETDQRLLILSDTKPGHVNQSIAYARHLGMAYDLVEVTFKYRFFKGLSYLADRLGIYTDWLFDAQLPTFEYAAVVSAGSGTYYANRAVSAQLGCKKIAIMLPKGYRYDFDLIVAQQHDAPPDLDNLVALPIKLTYVEAKGLVQADAAHRYISIVIGGDSKRAVLDENMLRKQVEQIRAQFPAHDFWLTTSRRTSEVVENMLRTFEWSRAVYYSQEPINPIPDFLKHSDYVFITADSSSMISEAVSTGAACIEVLPLSGELHTQDKFSRLLMELTEEQCVHVFDGLCGAARHKIPVSEKLLAASKQVFGTIE